MTYTGAKAESHYDNSHVYLMDCMDALRQTPDKYFDLAVVDPPYGIGNTNRFSRGKKSSIHKSFKWNDIIPDEMYFTEMHRISEHQIIWGCNYYAKYIPSAGRIVHNKILTAWSRGKNLSECDLASQSFSKKIDYFEYQWSGNVQNGSINWKNTGPDGRVHPQQKPIALYDWIYHNYLPNGGKVIDTHLGSGSNRIAADKAGNIEFYGFEIDSEYYEAQEKRYKIFKMQKTLF